MNGKLEMSVDLMAENSCVKLDMKFVHEVILINQYDLKLRDIVYKTMKNLGPDVRLDFVVKVHAMVKVVEIIRDQKRVRFGKLFVREHLGISN
jgi:hypothetical protein